MRGFRTIGFWLAALALAGIACGSNEYAAPPPPQVTVATPAQEDVVLYGEYTGTTRAIEAVEVRARVMGFLVNMHFEPGEHVTKDDLLFTIDPEPFQIALQAARAQRDSAKAKLDLQQTELDRAKVLYEKQASSELSFIQARAARDTAQAALDHAEADLRSAELDLDYCYVKAPASGRVGRRQVDIGNLVGSDEATRLTEIVRYSPLYVYFYISERDVQALQKLGKARRVEQSLAYSNRDRTEIQVGLASEEGYPHQGYIDYTALQIDPSTGTFEIRGVLENTGALDEIIVPGTFVRVRVPLGRATGALLVSERALGSDQSGRYLLVVNAQNVVEHRPVQVGSLVDARRVIETGLEPGDRVIVNGLQRARPGATVAPQSEAKQGATSPAASPSRG